MLIKSFMKDQHIEFNELNVMTDSSALDKLREKRLMQLPVIEIEDQFYTSNSMAELKQIIKESTNV